MIEPRGSGGAGLFLGGAFCAFALSCALLFASAPAAGRPTLALFAAGQVHHFRVGLEVVGGRARESATLIVNVVRAPVKGRLEAKTAVIPLAPKLLGHQGRDFFLSSGAPLGPLAKVALRIAAPKVSLSKGGCPSSPLRGRAVGRLALDLGLAGGRLLLRRLRAGSVSFAGKPPLCERAAPPPPPLAMGGCPARPRLELVAGPAAGGRGQTLLVEEGKNGSHLQLVAVQGSAGGHRLSLTLLSLAGLPAATLTPNGLGATVTLPAAAHLPLKGALSFTGLPAPAAAGCAIYGGATGTLHGRSLLGGRLRFSGGTGFFQR